MLARMTHQTRLCLSHLLKDKSNALCPRSIARASGKKLEQAGHLKSVKQEDCPCMCYNAHYKLTKSGRSFAAENAVYGTAQLTLDSVRVLETLVKTAVHQGQSSNAIMRMLHEDNCLMPRSTVQSCCHGLIILGLAAWSNEDDVSRVVAMSEAAPAFYSARQDIKNLGATKACKALYT